MSSSSGVHLSLMQAIDLQLPPQRSEGSAPFTIDEKIADAARNQFIQNFNKNRLYSTCSSLVGLASLAGFGFSVYKLFITPVPAIGIAVASFVLTQIWVNTRNREGYTLDHALRANDEDEAIRQLSLGANIYQEVWPYGGAAAHLFPLVKGGPRTVIQWFAEAGDSKAVAYLAMLEPNIETRKQIATNTLGHAKDTKTAQLLIDLGAHILGRSDVFFLCCLKKNLELVSFFLQNGASLGAGIADYEKWEADLDQRQRQFGGDWYPGNNEGVAPNLHPCFKTPLEQLVAYDVGPSGRIDSPLAANPSIVLKALCPDSTTVYENKKSAEDLYQSLNQAGIRIRRHSAYDLFERMNRRFEAS